MSDQAVAETCGIPPAMRPLRSADVLTNYEYCALYAGSDKRPSHAAVSEERRQRAGSRGRGGRGVRVFSSRATGKTEPAVRSVADRSGACAACGQEETGVAGLRVPFLSKRPNASFS